MSIILRDREAMRALVDGPLPACFACGATANDGPSWDDLGPVISAPIRTVWIGTIGYQAPGPFTRAQAIDHLVTGAAEEAADAAERRDEASWLAQHLAAGEHEDDLNGVLGCEL